ncbi:MAG: riboflavin synthase [Myxococcales bacterium]|nr:riboflavin synthase [Myxococcales bacterium]
MVEGLRVPTCGQPVETLTETFIFREETWVFTGIVEAQGTIRTVRSGHQGGKELEIAHSWAMSSEGSPPFVVGDSIAHDGVCLTVISGDAQHFRVEVGPETLERTTIGTLKVGQVVNLERSLTLSTRLGGHMVQGHVDAVGQVRSVTQRDNAWDLWVDIPPEILRLVIPRGSVSVDGISLTVVDRDARGFQLSIIPHTWKVTSLRQRSVGSGVNVEADLLVRYVDGLLQPKSALHSNPSSLTLERLSELGFGLLKD